MLTQDEYQAFLLAVAAVRDKAVGHLQTLSSPGAAIGFVTNLHRSVDKVVDQAVANGVHSECRVGCTYCCSARVEACVPQVLLIARAVKRLPTEAQEAVAERLRRYAQEVEEAGAAPVPCAFLVERQCSIYPMRPASCRRAHSLSKSDCANLAPSIPQDLDLIQGAEALMRGTAEAYAAIGLDADTVNLCQGVLLALSDAQAEARWARGGRLFEA
jgi:hypothetical protein